jgi:hypothetical protein
MANIDAPFGLKPVRHLNGSSWNGQTQRCYISANDATALYIGDPVVVYATAADRDATRKHLTIKKATAGDGQPVLGSIVSFDPVDSTSLKYRAASTQRYANVVIDPNVIYHIQDDGTVASTSYWPGANAVLIFTHAGSAYTGLSGVELNANAPSGNASNQLLILGLADLPANALGANAIWEVVINLHQLKSTGDGDGALGIVGA